MFSISDKNDKIDGTYNYIEIVLVNKSISPFVHNINFNETSCIDIMQKLMNFYPQCKIFRKHNTKYIYDLLEQVHCHTENTFTLNNINLIYHEIIQKNKNSNTFLINFYNKQPLPNHSFPSTTKIIDIVDSKRVSMKITNNIYLNFDSLEYSSDSTQQYHNIYININLSKSSDFEHIENTIKKLIDHIDY